MILANKKRKEVYDKVDHGRPRQSQVQPGTAGQGWTGIIFLLSGTGMAQPIPKFWEREQK